MVDCFIKYSHFLPLAHPLTAAFVAKAFFANIFKLHGAPATILSNRGSIFLSYFWIKLFELSGIKLQHTTTYHLQTDGQTERVN